MADAAYRVALWTILVGAYLCTGVDLPRDRGADRDAPPSGAAMTGRPMITLDTDRTR
jgi:hypothetical protein